MVRRNVLPDTFLDWDAINAVASGQDAVASTETATTPAPSPVADPLADLLQTPIRKLAAPLPVASSVLGETIFLCANDIQAASVRATGAIPYTPQEIDLLWELHQAVAPTVWVARLRLIHEAKRRFDGRIVPESES